MERLHSDMMTRVVSSEAFIALVEVVYGLYSECISLSSAFGETHQLGIQTTMGMILSLLSRMSGQSTRMDWGSVGSPWSLFLHISRPDIEVPVGKGMARRDAGHPKHSAAFQADQAYHDISTAEVKTESQKKFLELYQRYRWLQDDPITTIRRKKLFACTWADTHNGIPQGVKWSLDLRSMEPDYTLGREKPAVFLELKAGGGGIETKQNISESLHHSFRPLCSCFVSHLPSLCSTSQAVLHPAWFFL